MSLLALLSLSVPIAQAVPQQLTQQGRLLDSSGVAINGTQALTFRIYDTAVGGSLVWDELLWLDLNNGYYTTMLGADTNNPLDSSLLIGGDLWLEIQVNNNAPLSPRQFIASAPFARRAELAQGVDGGVVDAQEIRVGGALVVDSNGGWVGPTISVDWAQLSGVPADLADGDDDTLAGLSCSVGQLAAWNGSNWACADDNGLTEAEVEAFVTNGPLNLAAGSMVGGFDIVTVASDQDSFADLGLSCQQGDTPKYDAVLGWICDVDLVLDEAQVEGFVVNGLPAFDLSAGTTLGGDNVVTTATDQVLDENQVEAFVTNGALDLAANTTLNGANIMTSTACGNGELLAYNTATSAWECNDLSALLDSDGDGILAWSDCDDNDPAQLSNSYDQDCDGVLTSDDCDDFDPNSLTTAEDADCDGILTADDCDDLDPLSNPIANDADCDGVVTVADCDDSDSGLLSISNDQDCDGILAADDCDDTDAATGSNANDLDCDGVLTWDDCNDSDPAIQSIGSDVTCPADSCLAILNSGASTGDGVYWLATASGTYDTYCLMDTAYDGGGWTLAIKGTLDGSYNGSKGKSLNDAKGFLHSFTDLVADDILVSMGAYETPNDWVVFGGFGTYTLDERIIQGGSGSYGVDYNQSAPHSSTARSSSLSGITEVNNLSFRMSQTSGPNDAMFFIVTDGNCTSNSNDRTVSADCVGAMLAFGQSQFQWSNWENDTYWDTSCGRSGYRDGSSTSCSQTGGVFVR